MTSNTPGPEPGTGDADQPHAEQPDADQPDADQPDADQPGADQPGAEQPAAGAPDPAPEPGPADEGPTVEDPAGYAAAGAAPEQPTTEMPGGPYPGAAESGGFGTGYQEIPPETPPITAFALRHRLVRSTGDRKIAGVCSGLGRGTNTDPTFWRVILAVLTVFGGIGLLAYAVCWVIMPSDGDEVAPIESVFGRGRSGTPTPLTLLLSLAALVLALIVLNSGLRFTLLVAIVVTVVAVLLTRRSHQGGTTPAAPGGPPSGAGFTAAPAGAGPQPAGYQTMGYQTTGYQPGAPQPTAYQAPFAPHGPYHRQTYAAPAPPETRPATAAPVGTGEIPVTGWDQTGQVPPPPPAAPPRPPKPPRERSILGRLTLLACCLAIAALILLSMAGVLVPADAYIGVALGVVGVGLVVGAWRGRARWLIALGCVLAVALPISWVGERVPESAVHHGYAGYQSHSQTWSPRTLSAVSSQYHTNLGDATLNLSTVDFSGARRTVYVSSTVGDVDIILPSTVDTTVRLNGGVGDATLFGQRYSGRRSDMTRTDLGPDGKGGGALTLDVTDSVGDVEVAR